MFSRNRSLFVALLCILCVSSVFAQSANPTTGGIAGRVTESTGTGLPGVTVTAVNTQTGLTRTTVTENEGEYSLQLLQPGTYRVTAELAGLGSANSNNVTVLLGNATSVMLTINPAVTETITVTAAAPMVDVTRSGTATSVTEEQIDSLPIIGRDFRSLAQLTPGISDAFGSRITANGARGLATDYNIDGANSNNEFFGEQTGGTRAPFTFSQAAIKEFQVIRSQYSAEFSRGVGAQVNAITKSGTNDFAGELFYYARKKDWASTRPITIGTQTVNESFRAKDSTQPGFALGGPVLRDKLFFFVNGDFQRQELPIEITLDVRTFPQFTALSAADQTTFLNRLQELGGIAYADQLAYNQTFDQDTYLVKFDWNAGMKNHISLRDNHSTFTNANNQSAATLLSNQGTEVDEFNQLVLQAETVVTNNIFNQLIAQYATDNRPISAETTGVPEATITYNATPSRFIAVGQNNFLPNGTDEEKLQLKDSIQYMVGNHTFKAGAEYLQSEAANLFPRYRAGSFRYNSIAQFLANQPNTFMQAYGPSGGLSILNTKSYGAFLLDNFRVGTRWTFDVGVRYDTQTYPKPETSAFPQHPEFLDQIEEDNDNFAPRLGAAFDVFGNGRTVLRGGVGKFYGYLPAILLAAPMTSISGSFNTITLTCNTTATNPCPTFPNILTPAQFTPLAKVSSDIVTIGPDYEAQEAWRSSVQFEQQIGSSYSAGVGAIYSQIDKVQGSRNINITPSGTVLGNLPIYSMTAANRPYTDMGVVRELFSGEEANYTAFTLEAHKLAIGGSKLGWDISYTHARSIDQDTNERSTSTSFLYDPFNPELSEGFSDNDVRHRVVGDITYRLPWGIQIAGIGTWRTGTPYTAGMSFQGTGTTANSLNGLSQMSGSIPVFVNSNGDIIDLSMYNATNTATPFITRAQLATLLQGATILGRNTQRNPDYYNLDFRLSKVFGLPRGLELELLGEVFNALNTKNRSVGGANQNYYSSTYNATTDRYTFTKNANFGLENGYIGDPRQFQVAARLRF